MAAIDVNEVTVEFPNGNKGLDEASLSVGDGEFVALVGASGSGKTTLLRTIAGFSHPTSGAVKLDGEDVSLVPPELRGIGMVFQQHAVWPHMSVAANIGFPLKMAKVSKQRRRILVDQVLELVGLPGFGGRKPASLSGGQRQRVALARAIVAEPSVLLLDEALSALDEPLRDTLRRELVSLTRKAGLTAVHVTHDRSEALAIADRVAVMSRGNILQCATPQEIISRPKTPEVAAFLLDATLLKAVHSDAKVICRELGLAWPAEEFDPVPTIPKKSDLTLAVLSRHVSIQPNTVRGDNIISAEVTSVLFNGGSYSVTAMSRGQSFRVDCSHRPEIGEAIQLKVDKPLVYSHASTSCD